MIRTTHLFPILDAKLIELLRSLTEEEWNKPTVAKLWTVKDIAAHLLDGNIRTISTLRDGYFPMPDREILSYGDLVSFLNQLNADWVKASKRVSPAMLTDLLESTGKQFSELISAQDLNANALFPVAWAGEHVSKNWFHIAREYTEKWHHQQQIREAVGKQGIMDEMLFLPFIDTMLRGLPHTYRNTDAPENTCIQIRIVMDKEVDRFLLKNAESWEVSETFVGKPEACVKIPADTSWKIFTKAITPVEARETAELSGNQALAGIALNMVAVMA